MTTNETALSVPSDAEVEDVCARLERYAARLIFMDPCVEAAALIRKLHARAVQAEAKGGAVERALQDPENQPTQWGTVPVAWYDKAVSELAAARDLLREAGEALEPFGDVGDYADRVGWKDHAPLGVSPLTVNDFRRARDVLTKIKEADHGR